MILADRIRAWLGLATLLRGARVGQLVPAAALVVVSGVLPVTFILAMGQVVATVWSTSDVPDTATSWLVVAVLAMTAQQLLDPLWTVLTTGIARSIDRHAHHRLITNALSAPLATAERGDVSGKLADAVRLHRQGLPTPGSGAAALLPLTARYLQLGAAVAVVGVTVSWLVAVPLLAAAVLLRIGHRGALSRYFHHYWHGLADERKRVFYLHNLGTDGVSAKEIRALRLTGWLRERTGRETAAYLAKTWKARREVYFGPFLRYTAVGFGVGVFAIVTIAVLHGQDPGVAGLVVAAQATLVPLRFGRGIPDCDTATEHGHLAHDVITGHERAVRAAHTAARAPAEPVTIRQDAAITFEHVHFRYPGADRDLLRDVRLTIPTGRSTAIVGLNGAGKTTMIKLLAGFHTPTHGRITVGEHDLGDLDPVAWRQRIAALTQNFTRFDLTLRDNVLLGAAHRPPDHGALLDAITLANAREILEALPHGLDTVLSPRYHGGVGLSGGQWQRIALARALYAQAMGASLVVLDEPTAQLDPRAEAAFHQEFFELTAGVTTLVIAHRFSTVRRTDAIAVLDGGTITEHGTHDELLARSGTYATMFRLQADRFDQLAG